MTPVFIWRFNNTINIVLSGLLTAIWSCDLHNAKC